MSSTTSSTSSSSSPVVNGRYWGLATGLDVDSIVTGMLSDKQTQIDKAEQEKTKLEWKQEAYRDVISDLNNFENAYLQIGKSTSMASSNMYTVFNTTSSNPILSVKTTPDCAGGSQDVVIKQSATYASLFSNDINRNITGSALASSASDIAASLAGKSFNIKVDDITKTVTFDSDDFSGITSDSTYSDLANAIQTAVNSTLGAQKVSVGVNSDNEITISADTSGYYENSTITVSTSDSENDALSVLGLTSGANNRLDLNAEIGQDVSFTINGETISLTGDQTLNDAFKAINTSGAGVKISYDGTTDTITLKSTQSGASGSITIDDESGFFSSIGITATTATGRDAVISVNGTTYARSTNSFTIDGVSYQINGTVDSDTSVNLVFSKDTSTIEKGIQDFISAYNTLIDTINDYINTKPDRNYYPLTDSQKDKLSDTEAEQWTKKAKEGILFNDSTLQSVLYNMRSVLYKSVTMSDGTEYSLYDMGITTSSDYAEYGKLEIKTEDLSKFQNALANDSDKIQELFTKSSSIMLDIAPETDEERADQQKRMTEEGLAARLDDIVKGATGFIRGDYGSLIRIAGTTTLNTYNNILYNQLKDNSDKIKELKNEFNTKQKQLYSQFVKLETFMSRANSQSSIIFSMLGSH
jgi:flagellar hook-associated protein 2